MATLSSDKKYVTVEKGDTLSAIAKTYLGNGTKSYYEKLAAWNGIPNANLIYIGEKIYLSDQSSKLDKPNKNIKIRQFGLDAWEDNTMLLTWAHGYSSTNLDHFEVQWEYMTPQGLLWRSGKKEDVDGKYMYSTYELPDNAAKVRARVRARSKKNDKGDYIWNQSLMAFTSWSTYSIKELECLTPSAPSVELKDLSLTATLDDIDNSCTNIVFKIVQIVQGDTKVFKTSSEIKVSYPVNNDAGYASFTCPVTAGYDYKVCAQAYRNGVASEWSGYSSTANSGPAKPGSISTIKALSSTSVYLEWGASTTADKYEVQYTTNKDYFDSSNEVQSLTVESVVHHAEITGLESGNTYFFRVRATDDNEETGWTAIKSITIGKKPSAPTTWSSTTSIMTGESVNLYWVHNSEDNSSQVKAELELIINGTTQTKTITNSTDEDEKDKTSHYAVSTSGYKEGTQIKWRVRTCGITGAYGDWSVQRTVDVYAPPTLVLSVTDVNGNDLETLKSFPFYVTAVPGPDSQIPMSYTVSIVSNEAYETLDFNGNVKMVAAGEEVYMKNYDIKTNLLLELSAGSLDLEGGVTYTISCTVTMNSGLTETSSKDFTVSWTDYEYSPNADISIDTSTLTASIRPYCETAMLYYHIVTVSGGVYTKTDTVSSGIYCSGFTDKVTTTGEAVYIGTDTNGNTVYYCEVIETTVIGGVTMSVYRREYDGSLVEIATGLSSTKYTTVTDPHPSLDYARYRIVAIDDATGAVSYTDLMGIPIDEPSLILQWDDEWHSYDNPDGATAAEPTWAGSLLKLPYNLDVTESANPDVSLVEYIGRSEPVSYYGTHHGETMSCSTEIDKSDSETLYALRRLSKWMGDVYVREPSGVGYWANVTVSFSQKHLEPTIPVTLNITRVAGGV